MKRIPLTHGLVALVDDTDYEDLRQFKWYTKKKKHTSYATRKTTKGTFELMHRRILDIQSKEQVDHRDRNGLNCQRKNLRICTARQNTWNRGKFRGSSKFKGVCWQKQSKKWQAHIRYFGKLIYLGLFIDEVSGATAYDLKAKELFGEFANLNFPHSSHLLKSHIP